MLLVLGTVAIYIIFNPIAIESNDIGLRVNGIVPHSQQPSDTGYQNVLVFGELTDPEGGTSVKPSDFVIITDTFASYHYATDLPRDLPEKVRAGQLYSFQIGYIIPSDEVPVRLAYHHGIFVTYTACP
jgi:hypothetical protein